MLLECSELFFGKMDCSARLVHTFFMHAGEIVCRLKSDLHDNAIHFTEDTSVVH